MILVHRYLTEDGRVQYQLHLVRPNGETIKSPLLEKGEVGKWTAWFIQHAAHFTPTSPSPSRAGT